MTLLSGNPGNILMLVAGAYFIAHIPAFILLVLGFVRLKTRPKNAKTLLIIAAVYFVVGGGICGALVG